MANHVQRKVVMLNGRSQADGVTPRAWRIFHSKPYRLHFIQLAWPSNCDRAFKCTRGRWETWSRILQILRILRILRFE